MDSPRHAEVADLDQLRAAVAAVGCGWLVTVGADGAPMANLLPVRWQGDVVVVRVPTDNPQWRQLPDNAPVLVTCPSTPYAVRLSGRARVVREGPRQSSDVQPQPRDSDLDEVRVEVSVLEIRAELVGIPSETPRPIGAAARLRKAAAAHPSKTSRPPEEPSPSEIVMFFSEMAVYLSVAIWALSMAAPTWQRITIALGAVAAMGLAWGLLGSPKAPFPLRGVARGGFEILWFGVGILALWAAGQPWLAAIVAAVIAGNGAVRAAGSRRAAQRAAG